MCVTLDVIKASTGFPLATKFGQNKFELAWNMKEIKVDSALFIRVGSEILNHCSCKTYEGQNSKLFCYNVPLRVSETLFFFFVWIG